MPRVLEWTRTMVPLFTSPPPSCRILALCAYAQNSGICSTVILARTEGVIERQTIFSCNRSTMFYFAIARNWAKSIVSPHFQVTRTRLGHMTVGCFLFEVRKWCRLTHRIAFYFKVGVWKGRGWWIARGQYARKGGFFFLS